MSSACSANCPDGQGTQGFGYVYDRYANRWQQNVTAGSGPQPQATFNGNNNRIDGDSYDADGNLLYDGVHSYTYDAESRIVAVDGGGTATYVYDAEGRRVQKTTAGGTVSYIYDIAGNQVAEVNSSGAATREEVYAGGRHVATYANGTTYFDHADWLGTERMRTMVSGSACETIVSLAFGDGTATTGSCSDASPMHFTGKQHDDESNLDDFDARYYSSQWGRFISADWSAVPVPVPYANLANPQTLNLYAIVNDNVETFADLDGHEPGGGSCGGGVEACQDQKDSQGGISAACSETEGTAECKEEADEKTLKTASVNDGANGQQDVVKDQQKADAQAQQQKDDQNQQNQQPLSASGGPRTPVNGPPNTKTKYPNGTEREFGPDGKAVKDIDNGHPHDPEPHAHDWDHSGPKPKRGGRRDLTPEERNNMKVVAVGIGTAGVVGGIHTIIATAPEWGPWVLGGLAF